MTRWKFRKFLCRKKMACRKKRDTEATKRWSCEAHQRMCIFQIVVEMPMKWHERIHAQLTEWINEPMTRSSSEQWISKTMKERSNETMNQWDENQSNNESRKKWTIDATKQGINEWVKQWDDESMKQWSTQCINEIKWNENETWRKEGRKEGMNQSSNEWTTNEQMNEWTNKWMNESINQLIKESKN